MRTPLDPQIADRRVLEWVVRQRAQRAPREAGRAAPGPQPVITISRQAGSDAGEITDALRSLLGEPWQVWDSTLVDEIARRAEVRRQLVEAVDEREQSQIELTMRSLVGAPIVEETTYQRHLAHVLLTLAHRGYAIIIGRGGHLLLHDALKARLRASLSFRVENLCRVYGWTRAEAEQRVRDSDRQRAEFVRAEFERDIDDPDLYDLVLRTDTLGVQPSAAAIAAACRSKFQLAQK